MPSKIHPSFLYDLQEYFANRNHDPFAGLGDLLAKRASGIGFSLSDHIKAMIYALLSNNRPWIGIAKRLGDIDALFFGYDAERIRETPGDYFETRLRQMRCGNRAIHNQMATLCDNIRMMERIAGQFGSMDTFVTSKSAPEIVRLLTTKYKLRQMGEALVWEYIRNVGIDGAKPDIHLRRFLGRMGFSKHSPALATVKETFEIIEELHIKSHWERMKIDAYIWNFCSDGNAEICTDVPRCSGCPISGRCMFPCQISHGSWVLSPNSKISFECNIKMSKYEDAAGVMLERFGKDSLIAIATADGKRLYNRIVDAYYEDGAFYVSTYALSNKIKQIELNPEVAVCAVDWFSGHGIAKNLGWVLEPQNSGIRAKLRGAFAWYDKANDEQDRNCCILEIRLTDGMLIKDHHAVHYQIDFANKSALVSESGGEFK